MKKALILFWLVAVFFLISKPLNAAENFSDWTVEKTGNASVSVGGTTMRIAANGSAGNANATIFKRFDTARGMIALVKVVLLSGDDIGLRIRKRIAQLPSGNTLLAEFGIVRVASAFPLVLPKTHLLYTVFEIDGSGMYVQQTASGVIGEWDTPLSAGTQVTLGVGLYDQGIYFGALPGNALVQVLPLDAVEPLESELEIEVRAGAGSSNAVTVDLSDAVVLYPSR